jgi:hypothetical protein
MRKSAENRLKAWKSMFFTAVLLQRGARLPLGRKFRRELGIACIEEARLDASSHHATAAAATWKCSSVLAPTQQTFTDTHRGSVAMGLPR